MINKKKSQFVAQTSIVDTDFFDFVRNGQNFRVSLSDFKLGLGVTGTLKSIGSPLGVPVLTQSGTVFGFRVIESGSGILAQLSPLNGIEIGLNMTQDITAVPIIDDLGAVKPTIASLKAGANININKTDNVIQIDFVPELASSKTVVIATESDFPVPVAGVISLVPDIDYLIVNDVTTANRFAINGSNTIRAAASQIIKLTYTSPDTMFTMTNSSVRLEGITISATDPLSTLFNHTNTTPTGVFQMIESNTEECGTIGTFNNMFITRFYACGWEDIKTNGMLFTGTHLNADIDTSVIFLNAGTFLDLGTAVFNALAITRQSFQLTSTGLFLAGATDSANITAVGLGTVSDCRTLGVVATLSGISTNDDRWNFIINDQIPDTRADALLSMQSNLTETVITTISEPVLVAGTWVAERFSQMTAETTGRIKYDGVKDAVLPITASITVAPVSGGNISISAEIALNGVPIPGSRRVGTASAGTETSITVPWQLNFEENDFIEIFIENEDSTVDLLVSTATFLVN